MANTVASVKKSDNKNQALLSILLQQGLLTESDFQSLLQQSASRNVEELLIQQKLVDSTQLAQVKSQIFNIPAVDFVDKKVSRDILNLIPEDSAKNYELVAFDRDRDILMVAMVDPANLKAVEIAEFIAHNQNFNEVKYFVTSYVSWQKAMEQYSDLTGEVQEALNVVKEEESEETKPLEESEVKMEEVIKTAPVSRIVATILRYGVEKNASDIHIEPMENDTRVRYRIDGVLKTFLNLPTNLHAPVVSRIKVLANLKIDETRLPQDGKIRIKFNGKSVDFRVSTLPLSDREKVVLRILDPTREVATLDDLGFEGRGLDLITKNLKKPHGLFLVTGPTGSGKSTTLYAVLKLLNSDDVNIVTLEDPIEYYLAGVNQSQIKPEIGLTFANGLRSILRQDPDVIMVGEIRDAETTELAIHAGLTGHLVFSTLHTNDALGAIPRLIDLKAEPFLVASTLNIVVAQRLVRKICPRCRERIELPAKALQSVVKVLTGIPTEILPQDIKDQVNTPSFYHGKGCDYCDHSGYKDRIAIFEVLDINDKVKKLIVTGFPMEEVKKEFRAQGMMSLFEDGLVKAMRGLTTLEEVVTVTRE